MKVYRYMSLVEMSKLSAGIEIIGKRYFDCRTESAGICFLGENTEINSWDEWEHKYTTAHFDPIQCSCFLNGIVSRDGILVEFEIDKTNIVELKE